MNIDERKAPRNEEEQQEWLENLAETLQHIEKQQMTPPRPGLVFDRMKHRWVRPEEAKKPHAREYEALQAKIPYSDLKVSDDVLDDFAGNSEREKALIVVTNKMRGTRSKVWLGNDNPIFDPENTVAIAGIIEDMPEVGENFINVLQTYVEIADPDVQVSDRHVDNIIKIFHKNLPKVVEWTEYIRDRQLEDAENMAQQGKINRQYDQMLDDLQEWDEMMEHLDTKSRKVMFIDRVMHKTHVKEPTIVLHMVGVEQPAYRMELADTMKQYLDWLAKESKALIGEHERDQRMTLLDGLRLNKMLEDVEKQQLIPPRPGLVFDRTKHRWVRPEEMEEVSTRFKIPEMKPLPSEKEIQSSLDVLGIKDIPSDIKTLDDTWKSKGKELHDRVTAEAKRKGLKHYWDDKKLEQEHNVAYDAIDEAYSMLLVEKEPEKTKTLYDTIASANGHIVSANKLCKKVELSPWVVNFINGHLGVGGAGRHDFMGWPGNENDSAYYLKRPQPPAEHFEKMTKDQLWKELDDIHSETKYKRLPPDLAVRRERVTNALRKNVYGVTDKENEALAAQNSTGIGWFSDTTSIGAQRKRLAYYTLQGMNEEKAINKTAEDLVNMRLRGEQPYGKSVEELREHYHKHLKEYLKPEDVSVLGKQHKLITDYLRKKHGDTITLYRGIVNKPAHDLLGSRGQEVEVDVSNPSSFSVGKGTAEGYASSSPIKRKDKYPQGVTMQVTVPIEDVWVHGDLDAPDDWYSREEEFGTVNVKKVRILE